MSPPHMPCYNCKSLRRVTITLLDKDHLKSTLRMQSEMRLSKHGRFSSESISVKLIRRSYPKKRLYTFIIITGPKHSDRVIISDTCVIHNVIHYTLRHTCIKP